MQPDINNILTILRDGGIIAMPTDTVYGLHCDPHHEASIKKILALKQRSAEKGLILIADSFERFHEFIEPLSENIANKIRQHPGITWLVPAQKNISHLITGNFKTVAIRICQQPLIAELSRLLNSPLISTSANISTHPVAKNAQEIKDMFPSGIDLIIAGSLPKDAKPSKIQHAITDEIIR